jgi:anti-sigma B factor antagonist
MATIQGRFQAADRCEVVHVLPGSAELDLATADSLVAQGDAALDRHPRLLLLDLAGLSFADACGLSALVRIANRAEAAGCLYGLIAPQALVARLLRITLLDRRLPVFATAADARARLIPRVSAAMPGTPTASRPGPQSQRARRPEAARQQPAGTAVL